MNTRLLWLLGALLWAPAARAEKIPRVLSVIETPAPYPGEIVEELRVHLHRSHPSASQGQDIAGTTPAQRQEAFTRIAQAPPDVMVLLGPATLRAAATRPWAGTELIFAGIGAHGATALKADVARGVLESCPLDSLLLLARKLAPRARSIGWIRPAEDPLSGALWASLQEAADTQQWRLGRLDLPSSDLAPLASFVREHDAFVLLYPLADGALRRDVIRGTVGAHKPLFTCDSTSIGAGAVGGLIADAQQIGEALGQAVNEAIEQKPARAIPLDSGLIALNLQSACLAGVEVPAELLPRAVVYDKAATCPPPRPSRSPWGALALGTLAASLIGFWSARPAKK